ncbi:hypothetical protein [Kingella oralis]|jgi:hypothetical protein|nr:hypothetical protein [Kingella oralis]
MGKRGFQAAFACADNGNTGSLKSYFPVTKTFQAASTENPKAA